MWQFCFFLLLYISCVYYHFLFVLLTLHYFCTKLYRMPLPLVFFIFAFVLVTFMLYAAVTTEFPMCEINKESYVLLLMHLFPYQVFSTQVAYI